LFDESDGNQNPSEAFTHAKQKYLDDGDEHGVDIAISNAIDSLWLLNSHERNLHMSFLSSGIPFMSSNTEEKFLNELKSFKDNVTEGHESMIQAFQNRKSLMNQMEHPLLF
jgi:hypothetical protein